MTHTDLILESARNATRAVYRGQADWTGARDLYEACAALGNLQLAVGTDIAELPRRAGKVAP